MALALDLSSDALRDLLGGRLRSCTPRRSWSALRSPDLAGPDDIAILGRRVSLDRKRATKAGLRIVAPDHVDEHALEVPSPEEALATLIVHLARNPVPDAWLDAETVVGRFGEIARFARIHRSAFVGAGCGIGAGVVIHAGVRIGSGCTLCDNVVVGSPGFGLHRWSSPSTGSGQRLSRPSNSMPAEPDSLVEPVETCAPVPYWLLLPHRAGVVIEDDVFLGPQVNVAAGMIEPTWIGSGCRIDALVQIGHNARIGPRCVLAGQSGVAGSAELGADCMVGGQAAISDHVRLGSRCMVAARAGVTKSWGNDVVLCGFPARPKARQHP